VKLHTLGKMVPQFAFRPIGRFVHESLPFTPVITIRIISALPHRRNYRISIAETQTCQRALRLFRAYNTIDTTECSECTHFQ